jgi:hypothetical protein
MCVCVCKGGLWDTVALLNVVNPILSDSKLKKESER